MIEVKETAGSLCFKVLVVPRSTKNTIAGSHNRALKLKLTAPPVDGKANKACLKFLGKTLQVPSSAIAIESGHSTREKRIRIRFYEDKDGQTARRRIKEQLAQY